MAYPRKSRKKKIGTNISNRYERNSTRRTKTMAADNSSLYTTIFEVAQQGAEKTRAAEERKLNAYKAKIAPTYKALLAERPLFKQHTPEVKEICRSELKKLGGIDPKNLPSARSRELFGKFVKYLKDRDQLLDQGLTD